MGKYMVGLLESIAGLWAVAQFWAPPSAAKEGLPWVGPLVSQRLPYTLSLCNKFEKSLDDIYLGSITGSAARSGQLASRFQGQTRFIV